MAATELFTQWVHAASHDDHTADLRWLRSTSPASFWQQPGLYSRANSGPTKRLLRSRDFSCPCTAQDWAEAAKQESLEELELLTSACHPGDEPWDKSVCEAAAREGHMAVVAWLWHRVPAAFWDEACALAFHADQPQITRWLLHKDLPCPFEPNLPDSAWGQVGSSCDSKSTTQGWTALGLHCRLPSLGMLAQIPMDPYACREAAASNNMELMVHLRKNRYPWDTRTCNLAAANGHMEMLRWLRSQTQPCPWSAHTSQLAAENDRLDILSWLLSQQPACPFPRRPEQASDRCLQHLIAMGCPMLTPAAMARAQTLFPLPASLLLGLTQWHRKIGAQAAAPFRLVAQAPPDDLLAHLSSLPQELVWQVCHLAGFCGPVPSAATGSGLVG